MKNKNFFSETNMHIIFKNVAYWQMPILRILRYFKFNIYYLYVDANSAIKKNKIASKLKKVNVFPLPIEFEKNIYSDDSIELATTYDKIANLHIVLGDHSEALPYIKKSINIYQNNN